MTETWRYCGSQIKLWRTEAGVGREELAKEAEYEYETSSPWSRVAAAQRCGYSGGGPDVRGAVESSLRLRST